MLHRFMPVRYIGLVLWLVLLPLSGAWSTQGLAQEAQEQEIQETPDLPSTFEITTRYRALADSAARAERRIAELADDALLESEVQEAEQVQEELQQLLAGIQEAEYLRPERIARVRDQAVQHSRRLETLRQRSFERLEELDEIRTTWNERQDFWRSWRDTLRIHPEFGMFELEFQRALDRIEAVLDQVRAAVPDVLAYQAEIEALQVDADQMIEQVAAIRAGEREALLQRGEPVLLSPAYLAQVRDELWRDWQPLTAVFFGDYADFLGENANLIVLHILLILGLGFFARRLRRLTIPEGAWSGMLLRPWAVSVFISTAFMAQQYTLPPPLWDVLMWGLLAASGAVLGARLLKREPLKRLVYFFALFYPLFLLAEALQPPIPLFRMGLAGVAVAGFLIFGYLFLREREEEKEKRVLYALGVTVVMWGVVLGAEALGFYLLSRWILHAAITTVFVVFVVGFLVMMARGAVQTLLRMEPTGRLRFMRSIGIPVVERLLMLVQIALVIAAVLVVLDIWGLAPAPAETWAQVTSIGFMIGEIHITLGRILLSGLLVYLAILSSWLLRTFARSELYPRWGLERGVGDSINSLAHYMLIALGLLFALGALGVGLQNFAIVAGALGVGIGFGLQNIVNNFVSGLILLFERPVRVGDIVMIEEEYGTITKIGLRSTTVVTFDMSELIVPNADLVSQKVTNWTLSDPIVRMIVPVGVAYGTDVHQVKEILREVSSSHPEVMPDPPAQVLFMGFGDSSLDFEVRIWVEGIRRRLVVKSELLAEIERRFDEADIEIPFPQRDLHVRSVEEQILERDNVLQAGDAAETRAMPSAAGPGSGDSGSAGPDSGPPATLGG